jgi:hypothetical protein
MKNFNQKIWQVALTIGMLYATATAHAATLNAASCSDRDVSAAIASASNGDTVIVPNGACTWTSGISTSKQIALLGATVDGVTITHGAGSATLLSFTIGSSSRTRIGNLRFMPGSATGTYVEVQGSGLTPLMHDVYFNIPNFQLAWAVRWVVDKGGVIWRATFESTDYGSKVYGSDSGCLVVKGDVPWNAASTLGTLDTNGTTNLYIEDSTFKFVGQCPDVDDNSRVVIRRSQIIGSSGLTHGTTSASGGRQVELYDNAFTYPQTTRNLNRYFWWRAGTAVVTRNTIESIYGQSYGSKNSFVFTVENARRPGQTGCCTSYMCTHQPGSGGNGSSQVSDPVYFWDNSGSGAASIGTVDADTSATCGTTYSTDGFFKRNRDYFIDSGAKPGYVSYTYPHPLRQSSGSAPAAPAPLLAPTNVQVR